MEVPAASIAELVRDGPLSRSKIYSEIAAGRLRAVKAGRRTLVLHHDFERYLMNLPSAKPTPGPDARVRQPARGAEHNAATEPAEAPLGDAKGRLLQELAAAGTRPAAKRVWDANLQWIEVLAPGVRERLETQALDIILEK